MNLGGIKNNSVDSAPALDEIEISVFGPGYGESILLHLGGNNWFIVDSCIDPQKNEPIVINYLNKIGIDPAKAVKQIIATHWHDDHIRGLGEIVKTCKEAEFVYSAALKPKEFLVLVNLHASGSMMTSSGVDEFNKIINFLLQRSVKPKQACADRCLWNEVINTLNSKQSCIVYSLSPSDASINLAQKEIATLLPETLSSKNRVPPLSPNHTSVVLSCQIGNISILLGSDLD